MSAAAPVRVVIRLHRWFPEVWPSRVLRTETARVVSLRVTASSPRLHCRLRRSYSRSAAAPVRVVIRPRHRWFQVAIEGVEDGGREGGAAEGIVAEIVDAARCVSIDHQAGTLVSVADVAGTDGAGGGAIKVLRSRINGCVGDGDRVGALPASPRWRDHHRRGWRRRRRWQQRGCCSSS